jgi:hypothetical protein
MLFSIEFVSLHKTILVDSEVCDLHRVFQETIHPCRRCFVCPHPLIHVRGHFVQYKQYFVSESIKYPKSNFTDKKIINDHLSYHTKGVFPLEFSIEYDEWLSVLMFHLTEQIMRSPRILDSYGGIVALKTIVEV